jgi:hypothetical protein
MTSLSAAIVAGLLAATVQTSPRNGLQAVPGNAQTAVVRSYLDALERARYDAAFALLNSRARAYYRTVANFGSVFAADAYRITSFRLIGARGDERNGRVFFARETARFRDHAHDLDLNVTATVPIGVIPEGGRWRIKDPGHPWRAFAAHAAANANGVRVTVKKVSYFARRIETVVSFVNTGAAVVTLLPYGKSSLTDRSGHPYQLIRSRDWSLTDKTLFEGLRLAPNAEYTGTLAFDCDPRDEARPTFALTIAPLLADGAAEPFAVRVDSIAAAQ